MSELFLCEWPFPVDFDGNELVVDYQVAHPKAKADWVVIRKEYDENGKLVRELGSLLVRDSGNISKMTQRRAIVVRALNALTPISENCGRLIGAISAYAGRWSFYVFDAKEVSPSPRSTCAETTSPAPAEAAGTSADADATPPPPAETSPASPSSVPTAPDADAWSGW